MLTAWSRTLPTVCRSVRIEGLFVRMKSFSSGCFFAAGIPRRFGCCFSGELRRHVRRIAPQSFQSVVAAALFGEDVNDEVTVVDENPATGRRSLDEKRLDAFVGAHFFHDAVGNRLRLTLRVRRTEDEVVGDRGQ